MQKKNYKKQTQLIRGGITRSQHGETSEALFLTLAMFTRMRKRQEIGLQESKMVIFIQGMETQQYQCFKKEWL